MNIVCESFHEILEKYIEHLKVDLNNHQFMSLDNPKELMIGFICCDQHYLVRITNVRRRKLFFNLNNISKPCKEFLESLILNKNKRIELANIINICVKNSIKDVQKYFDLKVFS